MSLRNKRPGTTGRPWPRRLALGAAVVAIALLTAAATPSHQPRHGDRDEGLPVFGPGATYHPEIDREDFGPKVDNPWFPLKPHTTFTYVGTKDGKQARDVYTITSHTKVIDGVRCRVVFDRLFLNGQLAERTYDYYAQDEEGNVWYFGEDTVSLDDQGHLTDTSGSFRAGRNGAQPGVFMQAHPQIGRRFRQEWYKGQAEDVFRAVSRNARVTVPFGSFRHALRTEEFTALEPGVLDNKYYVRGIGQVVETSVKGPVETLKLVDVKTR